MTVNMVQIDSTNYAQCIRKRLQHMPTLHQVRMNEKKCMEDTFLRQLGLITSEGILIGYGAYVTGTWDPILAPGVAEVTIDVAKSENHEELMDELFQEMMHIAKENETTALQMMVKEEDKELLNWAQERGFALDQHVFASVLDVDTFDDTPYLEMETDPILSKVHFTNLAARKAEESRFWDLWWGLAQDVPGMDDKERPSNASLQEQMKGIDRSGCIVAVHEDEWVGLSMVIQETEDTFYNSMTGVVRPFRGKGIALALKLAAIEYTLAHGGKRIRTHNDSNNTPMIGLNDKLGYERCPGLFNLVKKL